MPHCKIDFSANVPGHQVAERLTRACHGAMLASQLFEPSSVKTRAIEADAALTGTASDSFIHVDIAIMPGRSDSQKQALLAALVAAIDDCGVVASSLTLEVRELNQAFYVKKLSAPGLDSRPIAQHQTSSRSGKQAQSRAGKPE
ncbi:5-carboxymethyl-2-hydroxymuconate isomerase [Shewanella sp. JM162201]|uniref:5-carboxymethyl-2-hydroxymuconate isomerase n=1 Tax=Shewanella jiangmenensis TaxID=2837387 RepID=A0ABS5V5P4_9GAMM|nr:5-carboxymethyl-2-hydroxymuconate isomerase [Shewanella jiangmenensis]